jgi:streptogramin lyase
MHGRLKRGSALVTWAFCAIAPLSSCQPAPLPGDAGNDGGDAADRGDAGLEDALAEATPVDASERDASGSDGSGGDASSGLADATLSEDAEAGVANTDATTDAAPSQDATSDGGLVCNSTDVPVQPHAWCVDGASCTPANQCDVGSLSCATLTCVDTGTAAADGTTCSSGTCLGGACSGACSAPDPPKCKANPCVYGSCTPEGAGSGRCGLGFGQPPVENGIACGSNAHQVCESGACTVIPCITNAECGFHARCDAPGAPCNDPIQGCTVFSFRCVSDPCMSAGVAAADGTTCGPDSLCSGAVCVPQLSVTATASTFTPGAAFTGTLGSVSDSLGTDTAASLTATIDWGDGSVTAGTVSGTSSPFVLGGSHMYVARTAAMLTITITDPTDGTSTSTKVAATVGAPFITEFAVADGGEAGASLTGSQAIAAGSDGNLWFTYNGNTNIDRMTPSGVVTQFALPPGDGASAITSGPDGNLWFPLPGGAPTPTNQIGRMTTSGVLTAFDIPTANAYPGSITAGPDGNVWFTEEDGNKVGRITPTGSITEFVLPPGTSQPGVVTTGPDGNLWFAENGGSVPAIARITTSGQVTEFPVFPCVAAPNQEDLIAGLTAGPDGNLWFTVSSASAVDVMVGRMSTAGAVSTFVLPLARSVPGAITAGPDGNLWLVDSLNNTIDRVTPTGEFTLFVIPTANSNPTGIVSGPGGRMWFSEGGQSGFGAMADGNIGVISPP